MIALAASASRWLRGGGWKWIGIGALVLAVMFFRWQAGHYRDQRDAARDSIASWRAANAILDTSVKTCTAAIADQNAAVAKLAADGQAKQNAAQAALRGATARAERAEVLADRIDAERAVRGSGGQECRSGEAVMEARGVL